MIYRGVIGDVTGYMAFVGIHGVERHNPNPDFYYQEGGAPLLDLGPYYLTVMVFLMGPTVRVSGMARKNFDKRQIENGPRNGEWMKVEVDTRSMSILKFDTGAIGSMTISFDIWDSYTPRFEIYGTEGTICISDPDPIHGANVFHGPFWYSTRRESRWEYNPCPTDRPADWLVAENRHGFNQNSRGLSLLDLALAVQDGRSPRASGALSNHVLDVMLSILEALSKGGFVDIRSRCERPIPLPENFPKERK